VRLLRTLTLVYAAVLTSALAASLISILVFLKRIAGAVGDVREALASVRDETAPLAGHLEGLNQAITSVADQVVGVQTSVERADEHLAALAAPRGPAEAAR